jgi:hypothetical protein
MQFQVNMEYFRATIRNIDYLIEFKEEATKFKPLNIQVTRYHLGSVFLLEQKKYYNIRRRLYNNITCINKLRDGSIRKYQVFGEFEIEVMKQYLTNKNILFRIIEGTTSYERIYISDNSCKNCFCQGGYPENNKVYKFANMYIEVYKGFVNCSKPQHRYNKEKPFKYGIYLY